MATRWTRPALLVGRFMCCVHQLAFGPKPAAGTPIALMHTVHDANVAFPNKLNLMPANTEVLVDCQYMIDKNHPISSPYKVFNTPTNHTKQKPTFNKSICAFCYKHAVQHLAAPAQPPSRQCLAVPAHYQHTCNCPSTHSTHPAFSHCFPEQQGRGQRQGRPAHISPQRLLLVFKLSLQSPAACVKVSKGVAVCRGHQVCQLLCGPLPDWAVGKVEGRQCSQALGKGMCATGIDGVGAQHL
jgi:hypothetical protein